MGHSHLGGKTALYLIDGLFTGKHPMDPAPRKMSIPPFNGDWPKSLFASQVYVKGVKGYVVLMSVGEEAVLTALAREQAKLGLILLDMRRAAEDLSKLI